MEKQLGAGTFLSMEPSSALEEGWNGLKLVGIPSSYQADHGLGDSHWLLPKPAILRRKSGLR
jgi:hypothetical protein